jgi:hypothetical protein
MVTCVCTLEFVDHVTVTGRIEVHSPEAEAPVHYTGAVERLRETFESASAAELRALFRNLAVETGAALEIWERGTWDRWAR